jgi:hypothetical protein
MLIKALTTLSLVDILQQPLLVNEIKETLYFSCGLHWYLDSFLEEETIFSFLALPKQILNG